MELGAETAPLLSAGVSQHCDPGEKSNIAAFTRHAEGLDAFEYLLTIIESRSYAMDAQIWISNEFGVVSIRRWPNNKWFQRGRSLEMEHC